MWRWTRDCSNDKIAPTYDFEMNQYMDETEVSREEVSSREIKTDDQNLKVILLWNYYFGGWNYEFGEMGQNGFITNKCPENRCIMTNNRDMEPSAHAIVYHY